MTNKYKMFLGENRFEKVEVDFDNYFFSSHNPILRRDSITCQCRFQQLGFNKRCSIMELSYDWVRLCSPHRCRRFRVRELLLRSINSWRCFLPKRFNRKTSMELHHEWH